MALTEGGGYLGEGTGYVLVAGPTYCNAPRHHRAELSERAENAGINSEINLRNALDTDTNVISKDGARDSLQSPAGQSLSCKPWHGEALLFWASPGAHLSQHLIAEHLRNASQEQNDSSLELSGRSLPPLTFCWGL